MVDSGEVADPKLLAHDLTKQALGQVHRFRVALQRLGRPMLRGMEATQVCERDDFAGAVPDRAG